MKIFLPNISDIGYDFPLEGFVEAEVYQEVEDGYIIKINNSEVFARSLFDLNIGETLKLKIAQSSPTQLVFKVVQSEQTAEPRGVTTTYELPQTLETRAALNLLSKLNLPITKERLELVSKLFSSLILPEKLNQSEEALPTFQGNSLIFHKFFSKLSLLNNKPTDNSMLKTLIEHNDTERAEITGETIFHQEEALTKDDIITKNFSTLESRESQNTTAHTTTSPQTETELPKKSIIHKKTVAPDLQNKDTNSQKTQKADQDFPDKPYYNKDVTHLAGQARGIILKLKSLKENTDTSIEHNETKEFNPENPKAAKVKPEVIKEYLALKSLNTVHKNIHGSTDIYFFPLEIPFYKKTYIKFSKDSSGRSEESPIRMSFIINTYNLGHVMVDLDYINCSVTAAITFEHEEALSLAKSAISDKKALSHLINTLQLKLGEISQREFLFENIKTQGVSPSINITI